MNEWSVINGEYPSCSYSYPHRMGESSGPPAQCQPMQALITLPPQQPMTFLMAPPQTARPLKRVNPRESRNRAEKQRRDKMSQSISRLASIVPHVIRAGRKVDKTSVLRLTAHYLRAHHHVFGKSKGRGSNFSANFTETILKSMKGFLITATYRGILVVVSPNIQEYLGYTQLELLGQNLYNITHPDDHSLLREQLLPRSCKLTTIGEILIPKEPDAEKKVAEELKKEKRNFIIRIKKLSHLRCEPAKYVTCHVEGSFRKSDRGGVHADNADRVIRRVRCRKSNPYASGNDIVFVGMVRPTTETFISESRLEYFKMEYRTRHSIDGSIIQCEQRISLVTGYMIQEVTGVNAMNFMHREDVRWVVVALREMYDQHRIMGESCYRLMTKSGMFIYMKTRGTLEVDLITKEATSFLCTNTVVSEEEGIQLIKIMKKKFSLMVNNEEPKEEDEAENSEMSEKETLPVEDPKQLEKVIFHLVTDLPSPQPDNIQNTPNKQENSNLSLAIIPPEREQIKEAIKKSYSVIKTLRNQNKNMDFTPQNSSTPPVTEPQENSNTENNSPPIQSNQRPTTTTSNNNSWADMPSTSTFIPNFSDPPENLSENIMDIVEYLKTHGLINNVEGSTSDAVPPPFEYHPASSINYQKNIAPSNNDRVSEPENLETNASSHLVEHRYSTTFLQLKLLRQFLSEGKNSRKNCNVPPDNDEGSENSLEPDVQSVNSVTSASTQTNLKRRLESKTEINEAKRKVEGFELDELSPEFQTVIKQFMEDDKTEPVNDTSEIIVNETLFRSAGEASQAFQDSNEDLLESADEPSQTLEEENDGLLDFAGGTAWLTSEPEPNNQNVDEVPASHVEPIQENQEPVINTAEVYYEILHALILEEMDTLLSTEVLIDEAIILEIAEKLGNTDIDDILKNYPIFDIIIKNEKEPSNQVNGNDGNDNRDQRNTSDESNSNNTLDESEAEAIPTINPESPDIEKTDIKDEETEAKTEDVTNSYDPYEFEADEEPI